MLEFDDFPGALQLPLLVAETADPVGHRLRPAPDPDDRNGAEPDPPGNHLDRKGYRELLGKITFTAWAECVEEAGRNRPNFAFHRIDTGSAERQVHQAPVVRVRRRIGGEQRVDERKTLGHDCLDVGILGLPALQKQGKVAREVLDAIQHVRHEFAREDHVHVPSGNTDDGMVLECFAVEGEGVGENLGLQEINFAGTVHSVFSLFSSARGAGSIA